MDVAYVIEERNKQPINIKVTNLTYVIEQSEKKNTLPCFKKKQQIDKAIKVVINDVSFNLGSGQMLAIMGPSGSGKTSLLNVLACRNMGGVVTGDIELNGVKHTKKMVETFSAYVRQDDRLLQHLTVKESLMFVGQLKLPTKLTNREINLKVDDVITEIGLSHVANTRVGGANIRGISGGERRRVSIGIQLLLNPSILLLDEPTSGLDAFTANHLIQTLAKLAKNQRTILLSIHQPRSDIFELFDMVLVLSMGQTVYFGGANLMVDYFNDLGFPCPELTNPSDFYLDLATVDVTSPETEKRTEDIFKNLVQAFKKFEAEKEDITEDISKQIKEATRAGAMDSGNGYPGFCRQFQILLKRQFKNIIIDYWFLLFQVIQAVVMSLIIGSVFWNCEFDQNGIRDRLGFLFMIIIVYSYTVTLDVIGQCHRERQHLYYELQDNIYGHFPFFLSKVLTEIPFHILFVCIYFTPAYFMTDLQSDADIFFTMLGLVMLNVYICKCVGYLSANIFPSYSASSMFNITILGLYIITCGFFVNLDSMSSGLSWISYTSPFRWAFGGMCLTEYDNITFTCGDVQQDNCLVDGADVLDFYSFNNDEDKVWIGVVISTAVMLVYQLLAFLGLKFVPQKPYEF